MEYSQVSWYFQEIVIFGSITLHPGLDIKFDDVVYNIQHDYSNKVETNGKVQLVF